MENPVIVFDGALRVRIRVRSAFCVAACSAIGSWAKPVGMITKVRDGKISVADRTMLRLQYTAEVSIGTMNRWEIFEEGENKPFAERVHVTLNRKHKFCLNGRVHEMMGRPEAVVLMFDWQERAIGIRPASPTDKGSFRLHPLCRGSRHRIIRAAPFCRHFAICVSSTTAFLEPRVDGEGVLLLDLKATTPARSPRLCKRMAEL